MARPKRASHISISVMDMVHTLERCLADSKTKETPIAPKRHHQERQQIHPILTSQRAIIRQNQPQLSRHLRAFLTFTANLKNVEHRRNPHSNKICAEVTPQILDVAI